MKNQYLTEVQKQLKASADNWKIKGSDKHFFYKSKLMNSLIQAEDTNFYVYVMAKGVDQDQLRYFADRLGYIPVVLQGTAKQILATYNKVVERVEQGVERPVAIFYYRDETTITETTVRSRSNHTSVLDKTTK